MADIVLFYPKKDNLKRLVVPTRLLMIACDPIEKGYNLEMIDQNIDTEWKEELREQITKDAKIVYFYVEETSQLKNLMEASKYALEQNQNLYTVFGGPWAQLYQGICMQDYNTEIVPYDESYFLLSGLMEVIEGKKKISEVPGILYRGQEGAVIRRTSPREQLKSLNELPKIPWGLCRLKYYNETINIFYSINGISYSSKGFFNELSNLNENYEVRNFNFQGVEDLSEFIKNIPKQSYRWSISICNPKTINKLSKQDLELLCNIGCQEIKFYISSVNNQILSLLGKSYSKEDIIKTNQLLKNFSVNASYFFKIGYPTETEEELLGTIRFIKSIKDTNKNAKIELSLYIPSKGDKLFDAAIESGYNVPKSLKDLSETNEQKINYLDRQKVKIIKYAISRYNHSGISPIFYNPISAYKYEKVIELRN